MMCTCCSKYTMLNPLWGDLLGDSQMKGQQCLLYLLGVKKAILLALGVFSVHFRYCCVVKIELESLRVKNKIEPTPTKQNLGGF